MAPATASRASQPLLLAQSATQPEEAVQLEKGRQQEQQELLQKQQQQKQQQIKSKKARRAMPKAAAPEARPVPEAAPPIPGSKRFGAGVIRDKESGGGE